MSRRVIAGARISGGVLDDEPLAQADQEIAEAVLHPALPVGDLPRVDSDARLPERPVLVHQGDERPRASRQRGGQVGQVLEYGLGAGIEKAGRGDRRQPPRVTQGVGHPRRVGPPGEERLIHGQLRSSASDGGQVMSCI